MWKPSVTPSEVLRHSQGPWEDHKYVKIVDGKYYYPNGYDEGRTISDLKSDDKSSEDSGKAVRSEYSKDDSDFDEKNYSDDNLLGDTNFYGFKGKDGRTVIVEEDKKWTLPKGTKLDSALIKRLEAVDKEIEKRRDNGEKISSDEWNKLVEDAINGTKSDSKKKSGSKSSGKKSSKGSKSSSGSKAAEDRARRAKNKATMKARTEEQQKNKQKRMIANRLAGKSYLNHVDLDDYLEHHGILGMQWGHRNGPPYPLDAGAHSPEEKRAHYQKSIAKSKNSAVKYKERAAKLRVKAAKLERKRLRRRDNSMGFFSRARRANRKNLKAAKLERKAARNERRVIDYEDKLSKLQEAAQIYDGMELFGAGLDRLSPKDKRAAKKLNKQRLKNLEKARKTREKNKKEAEKKEEILKKGSAKDLYKIKDKLSADDYNRAFTRLDNENKLRERMNTNQKLKKERFDTAMKTLQTVSTASTNFITLYNNGAKIYNTFAKPDTPMPLIAQDNNNKDKK